MFGGHRLRLRRWGPEDARRTAVFLHHGLGSIESWKTLPRRLSDAVPGLRCLAYERWGYGRSEPRGSFAPGFMEAEVPTLIELLDELNRASPETPGSVQTPGSAPGAVAAPVDLVGHSDGATIALLAASQHQQRVRSVVSIAAHTFVEPMTTSSIRGLLDEAAQRGPQGWLRRFHGDRGHALLCAWAEVWLGQEHASWDIRSSLALVRCPVLAVQGDADEFGSDEQLRAIGREVPAAETWQPRGVGHTPFDDEKAFCARVAEFWARA